VSDILWGRLAALPIIAGDAVFALLFLSGNIRRHYYSKNIGFGAFVNVFIVRHNT